jgi:hypothetical protein
MFEILGQTSLVKSLQDLLEQYGLTKKNPCLLMWRIKDQI